MALAVSCARPHPPVTTNHPSVLLPPRPVPPPKTVSEIRAVWVSDTAKMDWDNATRYLQRSGFNTMYVNLASAGAALYPHSRVLPSIIDGGIDPIAKGIDLAHQRGLAVYAKQIVMFSFDSPAYYQKRLLKSDLVMRGADGKPILQSDVYWMCPSQPINRQIAVAAISEMLTRYPVDGLQFDYIRFNEKPSCYCKHCRAEFEKSSGTHVHHWPADVIGGGQTEQFNEWRMALITDWVRELSTQARLVRPGVKVSAAVFPVLDRAREEKAQDWKTWLDRGYLDSICPMNYTPNPQEFDQRSRSVLSVAPRERVVMGLPGWKFEHLEDLTKQIDQTRRYGTAGFAIFSYDDAVDRNFLPNLNSR